MTTKTHDRADLRSLRQRLDEVRVDHGDSVAPFVLAMENFLTAAGYQDLVLMRSALEESKIALKHRLAELVEGRVTNSDLALAHVRQVADRFEGQLIKPDEQFDDLGRSLSLAVSWVLGDMIRLRDGPLAMARKHGIRVPNAAKLDAHIAQWEQVKANLVDCWPWTDAPLPPADRAIIARSRAALQAGERGENLEAVIARRRSK